VAEEILQAHGDRVLELTIVPSHGGRFVVLVGEQEVFNKKEAGRFPQPGEAARLAAQALPPGAAGS